MDYFSVTKEQIERFQEDGYLLVEGMFSTEEVDLLLKVVYVSC